MNYLLAAALALVTLAGCDQTDTRTPVERFGLVETPAGRPTVEAAIATANALIGTQTRTRLRASWHARHPDQGMADVPVYLIDGARISAAYVVMVPTHCRCIFVQPAAFTAWVERHTERLSAMMSAEPATILAFMFLHELGHIEHGDPGQFEAQSAAASLNFDQTVQKDREQAADQFAVDIVKRANANLADLNGWLASNKVLMTLGALQWNMAAIRFIENFGATSICSRAVFADSGYSHPNFELRLLLANNLLNTIPASTQLVDAFMNCRSQPNPGILFKRD